MCLLIYNKICQDCFEDVQLFYKDMINIFVGIILQTALVAISLYVVNLQWTYVLICLAIIVVTSIFLKKNWDDNIVGEGY